MNILSIPPTIMAGIALYVGVYHLLVYLRQTEHRENLTFALTCFVVGIYDMLCTGLYNATSATEGAHWQRAQAIVLALAATAFLWFIADYTAHKPTKWLIAFSAYFALAAAAGLVDRSSLTWLVDQPAVKVIHLSLGLEITYYEVMPGPLTNLQSIMGIGAFVYALLMSVGLYRSGQKKRARLLLPVVALLFAAILNDAAVSNQLYSFIYVIEYAYMSLVLLMAYSLSEAVVEAAMMKEAFRKSEERLALALEAASDGLFDWNMHTGEAYFSPRWYTMLGYDFNELPPSYATWRNLLHPDDVEYAERVVSQEYFDKRRDSHEVEFRMRTKAGEWKWILSRAKIMEKSADGQPIRMVGTHVDITERKEMENALKRAQRELEERVHERTIQLEAANQELEAFAFSVSHDLRSPLHAISGFSHILLEDYASQLSPNAQGYLHEVQTGIQQMEQLISDLLAFSRLGRQPIKKQPVAPAELVRQALAELSMEQKNRQVEIIVGELPLCQADPKLLKQVWVNILANALKFTRRCELARIEIGCQGTPQGERVYFVKDNGVGFDMRDAHNLFGVFQRLHRAEDFEGTGAGLAIAQRIIQRHGGRIWAEAQVNKGATFYFTI